MRYYSAAEVKECMDTYGQMVSTIKKYTEGVFNEKNKEAVQKIINQAQLLSNEIKSDKFDEVLKGLEKIVKGLPSGIIQF